MLLLALLPALLIPATATAQYFGRNKVRYEQFDFEVLHTEHFDIYYYPEEERAARDAGRMAERWYVRLSGVLDHQLDERKPIILYADDTDFQQTNVIPGLLGQGTGGVTESFKNRVVMPLTASYAETDHVLGHELVHVFQYDMAQRAEGERWRLGGLPLWFIEGMAEYLSVGRVDPHTAMWLRDAVLLDELPDLRDLSTNPRFFPYRFGQAFWSYVTGRWGDDVVMKLYAASARRGTDRGIQEVLGLESDQLVEEWHASLKEAFAGYADARTAPDEAGRSVVTEETGGGRVNLAPSPSPDGRYVAFLSEKDLFTIDLFLADLEGDEGIHKLTSSAGNPHFDALRFLESSGTWSPDGNRFAFVVFARGDNEITVLDVKSRKISRRYRIREVGALSNPSWSPDGRTIAFTGLAGGASDLFLLDVESGDTRRLTQDRFADLHPAWSPDGRTLAFATDRNGDARFDSLSYRKMGIGLFDLDENRVTRVLRPFGKAKHVNPHFGPDGRDLFFVSDPDGIADVFRYDLREGRTYRVTRITTGVTGITDLAPALSVASASGELTFSVFRGGNYEIRELDPRDAKGEPAVEPDTAAAYAGFLPPRHPEKKSRVSAYLADARTGLVDAGEFDRSDYSASLGLDYVGQVGVGIAVDRFGTALGGGVSAWFSDMLGNHNVGLALQVNGGVKDTGAQVVYQNLKRRYNWGAAAGHIPYLAFNTSISDAVVVIDGDSLAGRVLEQERLRVFLDRVALTLDYPLSKTRRIELGTGVSYYSYDREVETLVRVGDVIVDHTTRDADAPGSVWLGEVSLAYVGDTSFFGFVSPLSGTRYRLEVGPVFGDLQFQNVLADIRRYVFFRPASLAFRGLHFGRYGRDAASDRLTPLFVGYPTFVRGYDINSIDIEE
jgi:Tol biopolymer transport system component